MSQTEDLGGRSINGRPVICGMLADSSRHSHIQIVVNENCTSAWLMAVNARDVWAEFDITMLLFAGPLNE
jgi:hypothetical protein